MWPCHFLLFRTTSPARGFVSFVNAYALHALLFTYLLDPLYQYPQKIGGFHSNRCIFAISMKVLWKQVFPNSSWQMVKTTVVFLTTSVQGVPEVTTVTLILIRTHRNSTQSSIWIKYHYHEELISSLPPRWLSHGLDTGTKFPRPPSAWMDICKTTIAGAFFTTPWNLKW